MVCTIVVLYSNNMLILAQDFYINMVDFSALPQLKGFLEVSLRKLL